MSKEVEHVVLTEALREIGLRTLEDRAADGEHGFPWVLDGPRGQIVLDLPVPPLLPAFDPDSVGTATLDGLGHVRRSWGLAQRAPLLKTGESLLNGPLAGLVEAALRGESGALYHEGFRYCGGGGGEAGESFLLVLNAQEERQARRQADRSWRMATTLRRFGKAMTMNQNVQPLCIAAVHEVASATELAAALLWTRDPEDGTLGLVASVGVNRQGTMTLTRLAGDHPEGFAAELVAATRMSFSLRNVLDSPRTEDLEARFCYLKPGGLAVLPLVISDRLLGVLELVGRDGDSYFEENRELFETLAEHLALAVNSAQMFETFERLAAHDPLTGIANHRSMQEFLHLRLREADRTGQSVGVIMVDVDHFRAFNEEEGHQVGDAVLRQVADAIKSCVRPYDMAARYGGEEFTVVMPGGGTEGLLAAAERIRAKVADIPLALPGGRQRGITVSLGAAVYPEHADDAPSVLRAADAALYRAKRTGRNRAVVFTGHFVDEADDAPQALSA